MTKSPILIVEDNDLIARILRTYCERAGFSVDHAPRVKLASEFLVQQHYRLILMDLGLPDGDGKSLIHWIREEVNVNQNTPIIVISAHVDEILKNACLKAGANEVFVKPITSANLERLLMEAKEQSLINV